VEPGLPGLECHAHGRTVSKSWIAGESAVEDTQNHQNPIKIAYFFKQIQSWEL
jgi:hypothetical protein